jgi:molybdopterin/thiamine biosynthesis adenylyltransferase
VVYPEGITEATADEFLAGCSIVCDEIELLALDARILLHARSRAAGVSLFNCNTVGFGTNLFLYTPESMTMEEAVGMGYEEAQRLSSAAHAGDESAIDRIASAIIRAVIPSVPDYAPGSAELAGAFTRRVREERKAPIIATNPPMAGGFLADRVLLYLLRDSGVRRMIAPTPVMPGYLHFDAASMQSRVVTGSWLDAR